uniref:SEFIR domain-containing protein n=1 Tax=Callorhinchus milii TaxID=7868 RepID=A0A4W3ITL9_CALMI|eukprot:gi/632954327/ref/XP_007892899.1/ PREDICTED: interleukin-17 receptor A isoform X1 [Callorhinchus milii]
MEFGSWALHRFFCVLVSIFMGGVSGLQILTTPPMDCSQESLNCSIKISGCLDHSWLTPFKWTPSSPKEVMVNVSIQESEPGIFIPVLLIKWKLGTDASIRSYQGVQVSVQRQSDSHRSCLQYRFRNRIKSQLNPQREKWSFSLERFVVEPEYTYLVDVYSLPRRNINEYPDQGSMMFVVPGCKDGLMKRTELCKRRGSMWEPNITHSQHGTRLSFSFWTGNYSQNYTVFLRSHSSLGFVCNNEQQTITEEPGRRVNVTFFTQEWMSSCCHYSISIQPFFVDCYNDCVRHQRDIPCPEKTGLPPLATAEPSSEISETSIGITIGIVTVTIVLLGVFLFVVWVQMKCRTKIPLPDISTGGKKSIASEDTERPQVVKRVLIVYSLDHVLYKDIVLAFAEFLLTVCGTEVILDLLQTNTISEVGHLNWLAQHKKTSDKIIILCSRGTRAKWTAMLGTEQSQVLLRGDERSPMRDMFTPAMNLIVPDFKKPASFGKYIVAYFDGISEDGDVPDPFNVGVKYKLMKQFEEIHFRVQDLEKYEPGKTYQVPGITSDDYHKHPSGERLRNAIRKFQRYQMEQPDWFEKECLLSAEEAGAEEEEECDRELGDDPSSIRQNVLLLELQDAAGCCVNQLQVADSSHPTFVRCLPTLECRAQITGVSQNVIGMDGVESPALGQTYIREPICCTPVSECNQRVLLSSSLDSPHEEDPLLAAGRVMRNEIVQQASGHAAEDHCVRNDVGCPAPAQSDARQRLAELQQALLLQGLGYSQIPAPEPHHLPESAPFILLPAKEESVESDQGYCSKLYLSAEELHSGRASVLPDALKELEMLQIGLLQESMETAD